MKLAARELPTVTGRLLHGDKAESGIDFERVREHAEHAAKVLGDLRGLALKIGQTASYVDGLLPPEATEVYQKALARLQSAAPTVSFDQIRAEIERGIGKPLGEAFTRFDEVPVAAASIGQVHRAAIVDPHDPTREVEVAVKVQYPSIAQALTSDLKNLDALHPMIAVMAPGADTRGGMDEVVNHIAVELDYQNEARNQEMFRDILSGWEGAMVPRVYHSHTARNVLTMEFIPGRTLREVAEDPDQDLRNRVGATVFRFSLGLALGRGIFNTDPHPGNYLVRDDGTVAFLDFGSVKVLPDVMLQRWQEVARLLVTGRHDEWRVRSAQLFGMEAMDPRARRHHQELMLRTAAMVARDEEVTIDRKLLRDAVQEGIHTAKEIGREVGWIPSKAKTVAIPPDFVMVGRMQVGLIAVLAHLRPRANWNRILRAELGLPPT